MSSSPAISAAPRRWSQPLVLLCAVQSCERFAFLAMLPMFVLYARERLAMSAPTALMVLAILQALSYLGGLPSGWLADRRLGVGASTLLGALLLTVANAALALDRAWLSWPALTLMVAGQSLFRPGLHVLIAQATGNDERARERGFLWHYLSANLGYAAGALFGEWAHAAHGWASLFLGATVASMLGSSLLALPVFRTGPASPNSAPNTAVSSQESMAAVWMLCSVAVVFWLTAQQAGSSLSVFAAMNTTQQITLLWRTMQLGPGHFAALHGLMVLAMLPVFLHLHGRKRARNSSTTNTLIWGYGATAGAFALMAAASLQGGDAGRVSGAWLLGCYVLLSIAEVLLAPLGVSLITRLAPPHKTAQAVGLWFASSALGSVLAAVFGLCWDRWSHHRYFALLALLSLGSAIVLWVRRRQLADAPGSAPLVEADDPSTGTEQRTDRRVLVAAAMSVLVPIALLVNPALALPLRGVSSIVAGLGLLLCGPVLFSRALVSWARPFHAARR